MLQASLPTCSSPHVAYCADADQQRQLAQLLGELRRLEVQQDTLKKAVMENRPIVVHPRMKPQEEEEEEEQAKPAGPAKPKYIASGGWNCMCLKLGLGVHGAYGESCRSGAAKQVQNRSRRRDCQAGLGVSSRVLGWGDPASPAQPEAVLPLVDELVCQW